MEILMKHISDPVPVPARGSVPAEMVEPLMRCLAKRPDDRWPTARAFATALLEGLEASGEDADDFAPTMAMERPDFSATQPPAPLEPRYEPTVLSARPLATGKPKVAAESKTYEPTVLSSRASVSTVPPRASEPRAYEPTVLSPRAEARPVSKASPVPAGDDKLKIAAAGMVGLGATLLVGGLAAYAWWNGSRTADSLGTEPPLVLAQGSATDRPLPPAPEPTAEAAAAERPAEDPPADPEANPPSAEPARSEAPVAQATPSRPSGGTAAPSPSAPKPPKPGIARAPKPEPTPEKGPTGKQAEPAEGRTEVSKAEEAVEASAGEAVPESARSWTTAREVDRTVSLRLERSVDLGVKVAGVPVDRVFLTARDTRSGIKKFFKKSTEKKRFTAEFLLNCPADGSRPKLNFEVELLREEGAVLERLSEKRNCDGHVKLSSDVAIANLDEARKVRIRVRSAG